MASPPRLYSTLVILLSLLSFVAHGVAQTQYVTGTDGSGVTRELAVNRYPALYTGAFGDCLGGQSLFNITKYDAAYYSDNLTIAFHLDGTSNIKNDSLMMHISVEAYGSSRFDMTFDPCNLNLYSLCPLNASVPITAWAVIPVGPQQVGGIPEIAFSIPDFEGFAKLQIFSNSSQTEIGCFQAIMRNGNSMSQPAAVAPILGIFTLVAIAASFLTATYGISIPHMRMHFAHSLSVLVLFETFQSIFLSGLISVNWPSILVAWWSNFAWSAGMIHSSSIINSLAPFTGISGSASQVGGAGSVVIDNGGGLSSQIYGRSAVQRAAGHIAKRAAYNASDPYDYTWAGGPVSPGMPLPGTWSGFAGALSVMSIPAADAFLVAFIWFLVAVGLVILCLTAFKFSLEGLSRMKSIKQDRLGYFRRNWLEYLKLVLLRTFFIAFFMMMTLTMFQFTVGGSKGATAIAGVVFAVFLIGVTSLVVLAIRTRTRFGKFQISSDKIVFHHSKVFKAIPVIIPARSSILEERRINVETMGRIPFFRIQHINDDPARETVHQDQAYIKRFGWLSARYRRSRWWFFTYYIGYQFVRACFLGAASQNPSAQIYGLLIFEIVAFAAVIILNPFEGSRNTSLAVWMLSISKIVTTGLSIAFLPALDLDRIIATVIGVIIVVVQGFMVIALMILVGLGAMSSWMSLSRNHEEFEPEVLDGIRVRYFTNMEAKAPDNYLPPKPKKDKKGKGKAAAEDEEKEPKVPKEPYFSVTSVRRAPKIEDEEGDIVKDLEPTHTGFDTAVVRNRPSRSNSLNSRNSVTSLRRGARPNRKSWSSKDFAEWDAAQLDLPDSTLALRLSSANSVLLGSSLAGNTSTSSAPMLRPQRSIPVIRIQTPSGTGPSSPLGPNRASTPTMERLQKHAEETNFARSPPPNDVP